MAVRPVLFASVAVACAVACSNSEQTNIWGDDASTSSSSSGGGSSSGDGGSSSGSGGSSGSSGSSGGSTSSGGSGGSSSGAGAVSCSAPSMGYAMNGGTCGTWRWAVKTGTDNDVGKVNLTPQVVTIPTLTKLATSAGSYCSRTQVETTTYELKDVELKFEHLETDSDYHLVATDPTTAQTMIVEVPYPGCVGHNACTGVSTTPFLCDITHARAAVDAKNPGAQSLVQLGTGTVIGVGFYDTDELMSTTPPTGMAPNGIELHPVLAICFGKGCNPLQGY